MNKFTIRNATPQDTEIIYDFIRKMAIYEKLESEMDTSVEALHQALFVEHQAEVVIGEENGQAVGFALFSIISRHSKGNEDYTSKSCSLNKNIGAKGMAKHCYYISYKLPLKGNAAEWIGWYLIGMLLPLHFTNLLAPFHWMIGPFSV